MAVASAGPYASLDLTPDRQKHQHPTTLFFTGQMPFLSSCRPTNSVKALKATSVNNDIAEITNSRKMEYTQSPKPPNNSAAQW